MNFDNVFSWQKCYWKKKKSSSILLVHSKPLQNLHGDGCGLLDQAHTGEEHGWDQQGVPLRQNRQWDRREDGGEGWPGCPTKDRATNTTLTWRNAKDSEVSVCHCGKWQKAMDDPEFVFVTILLWFSFSFSFVHSACVRGHYISLHQLSLSIVIFSTPGNLMPVLHFLAPDEEAIGSKVCANKFFISDLSLLSELLLVNDLNSKSLVMLRVRASFFPRLWPQVLPSISIQAQSLQYLDFLVCGVIYERQF